MASSLCLFCLLIYHATWNSIWHTEVLNKYFFLESEVGLDNWLKEQKVKEKGNGR